MRRRADVQKQTRHACFQHCRHELENHGQIDLSMKGADIESLREARQVAVVRRDEVSTCSHNRSHSETPTAPRLWRNVVPDEPVDQVY